MSDSTYANQRFLVRVGRDHKIIDRLLAKSPTEREQLPLDGVVIDASKAKDFKRVRENLSAEAQVLTDPVVYRLQEPTSLEVKSLVALPYAPPGRAYIPSDFARDSDVREFVKVVLDTQHDLRVTDYMAPAFYVATTDSPWRGVNQQLLRETVRQVGGQVYATLCASSALMRDEGLRAELVAAGTLGVYVLISPLKALGDSVSKIVDYIALLTRLRYADMSVVAARQPAFGLCLTALGIASFDAGIAEVEAFDYRTLVRKRPERKDKSSGGRAERRVYLPDLKTIVPRKKAEKIFSIPALRGLLLCENTCCSQNTSRVFIRPEEHFLWSRVREVQRIRETPQGWRVRTAIEEIGKAREIGEKIERMLPELGLNFGHLSNWERAMETVAGVRSLGERREL